MVHGLAAQSGGLLDLKSEVGRGTTATIYLPSVEVVVGAKAEPKVEAAAPSTPLRVLLVDDEELVRVATAEMLQSSGHEVHQAASAPAALQLLRQRNDFDALIADYMMPGMTGVALVSEARRVSPNLPALLITGYAGLNPSHDDGLRRLGKPFGQRELECALIDVAGRADPNRRDDD